MEQLVRTLDQIGNAIRRRRKILKLSQAALCGSTGLRQATISNFEAGDSGAQLKTFLSLLAALDLELIVRERTKAPRIEDIF
jgi:HTH-type transcriptional regulator/antitoxin HipB